VTTQTERVAVLPRDVASRVITTAVSRGAWGVSLVILILAVPVLIDVLAARDLLHAVWVPAAALLVMLGLLCLTGMRPSTATRVLSIVVGSACAFAYTASLLVADPGLNDAGGFLLNRPAMVLVLTGSSLVRPAAGLAWSVLGYACATLGAWLASVVADVAFAPGWGPTLALGVYAGAFLVLAAVGAGQAARIPDLARLERDTRRLDIEHQFEQRAAAIVHDTVLGDLTAVMNSEGRLDSRTRERFRADVATLGDESWLRESAGCAAGTRQDGELRNAFQTMVSDFQWRGLRVDVTGDTDAVIGVPPAAASSLLGAVRACLENVLQHADTAAAELVVAASGDVVTVMVVDNGRGFEPDGVPHDRLGLRSAVMDRVQAHGGSVRIWSRPGSGTSVLLSVPATEQDA
jgi:signal transduction histidine kinase